MVRAAGPTAPGRAPRAVLGLVVGLVLGLGVTAGAAGCERGPGAAELERLHAEAVAANQARLAAHATDDVDAPGRSLTVLGELARPSATLDWAALERLGQAHVRTTNPQSPTERGRVVDFRGVLVRDLLDQFAAAPAADEITFVALDGFRSTVPAADLRRYRVLLAIAADGARIERSSGGPIFLVFPHSESRQPLSAGSGPPRLAPSTPPSARHEPGSGRSAPLPGRRAGVCGWYRLPPDRHWTAGPG